MACRQGLRHARVSAPPSKSSRDEIDMNRVEIKRATEVAPQLTSVPHITCHSRQGVYYFTATQINSGLASAMQLVGVPHITYHNEQGVHCFVANAKIQLFESLSRAFRKKS